MRPPRSGQEERSTRQPGRCPGGMGCSTKQTETRRGFGPLAFHSHPTIQILHECSSGGLLLLGGSFCLGMARVSHIGLRGENASYPLARSNAGQRAVAWRGAAAVHLGRDAGPNSVTSQVNDAAAGTRKLRRDLNPACVFAFACWRHPQKIAFNLAQTRSHHTQRLSDVTSKTRPTGGANPGPTRPRRLSGAAQSPHCSGLFAVSGREVKTWIQCCLGFTWRMTSAS